MDSKNTDLHHAHSQKTSNTSNSVPKLVVVGFVDYPNVGKSSTINALVGEKRTGVTSTPGKTKHFQALVICDELVLCDCPGLMFPSFTSSRHEMIASGVLPIDRMTLHSDGVQVLADCVPHVVIEKVYNIKLPKPKPYESQSRPPLTSELLRAFCRSRGYVASVDCLRKPGLHSEILKDCLDGKLPHFEMPPGSNPGDSDWEMIVGPRTSASAAAVCNKTHLVLKIIQLQKPHTKQILSMSSMISINLIWVLGCLPLKLLLPNKSLQPRPTNSSGSRRVKKIGHGGLEMMNCWNAQ